jgi:hypothetical protein
MTRDERNTEFEDGVDLDIDRPGTGGIFRRRLALTLTLTLTQNAVDAADQPLESGMIDLISATETMDDASFSPFCSSIPDGLGEGVVGDG